MKRAALTAGVVVALGVLSVTPLAQVRVGPNINMATGIDEFTGDPYLQRQNEVVIGISSVNPDHMIAFMNDYRTIDYADDSGAGSPQQGILAKLKRFLGIPTGKDAHAAPANAEGWMGVAVSNNGGKNWSSGLVNGYPNDMSAEGAALHGGGYQAASDPWVSCDAQNCHLIGIAFTRGGGSALFYARYTDTNDSESGHNWKLTIPPRILRTGSNSLPGQFIDKPTIVAAADGTVAIASVEFDGQDRDGKFQSKVLVSVSHDFGATWSAFSMISQTLKRSQSPTLLIDPNNPRVLYAVWRVFGDNTVILRKSIDGGASWGDKGWPILSQYQPFDQATQNLPAIPQFRTSAYAAAAIDGSGTLHVAITERTDPNTGLSLANGTPRVVLTSSSDGGLTWTSRKAIDYGPGTGPQFMPAIAAVAEPRRAGDPSGKTRSKITVLYYDARASMRFDAVGPIAGADKQFEVRVAQADPWTVDAEQRPVFEPSTQVSRYVIDPWNHGIATGAGYGMTSVNRPYPMFWGGSAPFTGDYNLLVSRVGYIKTATGWRSALATDEDASTNEIPAPVVHAVWADGRDVILPRNPWPSGNAYSAGFLESLGWWNYQKPGTGNVPDDQCNAGSRNQNPYTAEISSGVVAAAPVTFKDPNLPRSYPVYVNNTTADQQYWRLTIDPSAHASFSYTPPARTVTDIGVKPYSTVTGTVFIDAQFVEPVHITLQRIDAIDGSVLAGASASTTAVTVNTEGGTDPAAATTDTHDPQVDPTVHVFPHPDPTAVDPYVQDPFGQNPFGQNPFGQNPFGQNPFGQNAAPREITDVTFIVTNGGSTASAYKAFAGVQQNLNPDIYKFQIIVNRRTTTTGLAGCAAVSNFQPVQISSLESPFGQNPFGQNPFGQNPFGQNPFGQNPFGQNPFGQNPFGQNPFGQNEAASDNSTFYIAPSGKTHSAQAMRTTAAPAPAGPLAMSGVVAPRAEDEIWYTLRVYRYGDLGPNDVLFDPGRVNLAVVAEAPNVHVDETTGEVVVDPPPSTFTAPDLTYASALAGQIPATALVGGTMDMPAMTVLNAGTAEAGAFRQGLYLRRTGAAPDVAWTLLGLTAVTTAPVGAGATTALPGTAGLFIPSTLTPDNYNVCAFVDATDMVPESSEANNSACATLELVAPQADIAATVSSAFLGVIEGQNGTTTAAVTNNGPNDARNVILVADFPGPVVTATPSGGSCAVTPPSHVDCRLGVLPPAATATVDVVFTPIVFTISHVTVSVTTATQDPQSSNDSATQLVQLFGVPRTFTVTNTNDNGPGSLRQAILDANAHPVAGPTLDDVDTIAFNIGGTGVQTVRPASPLPQITDGVILDATTQPGYAGTPLIELDGSSANSSYGLLVHGGHVTIRGLAINRFTGTGISLYPYDSVLDPTASGHNVIEANHIGVDPTGTLDLGNGSDGIYVASWDNVLGSANPASRNVISGNAFNGILMSTAAAARNRVIGNYIGTNAAGMLAIPNGAHGVSITGANNTVGGRNAGDGNVISGNAVAGVSVQNVGATGNRIEGNIIGVTANCCGVDANRLPNGMGVLIASGATSNVVGVDDSGVGRGNVISGNTQSGILITQTDRNLIGGNGIGGDLQGDLTFANFADGITISNANNTLIGGGTSQSQNRIKYNLGAGVRILSGIGTLVTNNRISENVGLGIDVGPAGVTPNDAPDLDGVPNHPVLTSVTWSPTETRVLGTFNGKPNTTYNIMFGQNAVCDASGYGEGDGGYIGITVVTDASGNAVIDASLPPGTTAGNGMTALTNGPDGVAEYSNCVTIVALTIPGPLSGTRP